MYREPIFKRIFKLDFKNEVDKELQKRERKYLSNNIGEYYDSSGRLFQIDPLKQSSILYNIANQYGKISNIINDSDVEYGLKFRIEDIIDSAKEDSEYYDEDGDLSNGDIEDINDEIASSILGYYSTNKHEINSIQYSIEKNGISIINNRKKLPLKTWLNTFSILCEKENLDTFYGMNIVARDPLGEDTILNLGHPLVCLDLMLNYSHYNKFKYYGLIYEHDFSTIENFSFKNSEKVYNKSLEVIDAIVQETSNLFIKKLNSSERNTREEFFTKILDKHYNITGNIVNNYEYKVRNRLPSICNKYDIRALQVFNDINSSTEPTASNITNNLLIPITQCSYSTYMPYYGVYYAKKDPNRVRSKYKGVSLTPFLSGNIARPAYEDYYNRHNTSDLIFTEICVGGRDPAGAEEPKNLLRNCFVNTQSLYFNRMFGEDIVSFKNACLTYTRDMYKDFLKGLNNDNTI